jgi:uncharacterized protein
MYRLFLLAGLFTLSFSDSFAQYNTLLWEISGNGLEKPSYLYGTMHLKDKRVFNFGDSVMVKFSQCNAFAGEVIFDKEAIKSNAASLRASMMMPGDTTLKLLLGRADYKMVKKAARKRLGVLAFVINKIKPIYSSMLISEPALKKDESKVLDEYFQDLAASKKMKLIGIESIEEQLSALDKIPLREQADMLVEELKADHSVEQEMEGMISLYCSGNLDSLLTLMNLRGMMSENFNDALLLKRNYVMAERIGIFIKDHHAFIGIGAAHLPGKEGVIELLRAQGFTVRPVYSSGK